jgi:hypothetical protein
MDVIGASMPYINLGFPETLLSSFAESHIMTCASSEQVAKKVWSGEATIPMMAASWCVKWAITVTP